jgi:tRNA(Ile)-lysidine synthase
MKFDLDVNPGRYVVAVSGGVDSVVLLNLLMKLPNLELIVAHFDHGIRDDSHLDAKLVRELAEENNLQFEMRREELGEHASEEFARDRRYEFLFSVMKKYDAKLITAHHGDDVIESVAINFSRGTGWRGLAVLDSENIIRPMTRFFKSEIREFAEKNNLEWHEDSTNVSDLYLRNRFRKKLIGFDDSKKLEILSLWSAQKNIKSEIEKTISELVEKKGEYERKMFFDLPESVAIEIIRYITNGLLTRPQMMRTLAAIKTFESSKVLQPGGNLSIRFSSRNFIVKLIK